MGRLFTFFFRRTSWCVFGSGVCTSHVYTSLCGFRPTGRLHLGHYFSVIKPGQSGCNVLIANYHAPEEKNLEEVIKQLERFNIANIRLQKEVFDPVLYFQLLAISKIGDLSRMTQYKSTEDGTAQLLTYPVLMAHDVAGYSSIIVGEDQKQHLEYARKLLRKHNSVYGTSYPLPVANIVVGRIKDLRDSTKKMSKSSPKGCLFLDDKPEEIRSKLRKASVDDAGLENLRYLYAEFVGGECPGGNEQLKDTLAKEIISRFA